MTLALRLYRGLTVGISPLVPMIFRRRLAKGKELPGRLRERQARGLPARPEGKLVWMHGASIGESKLLLGLATVLAKRRPDLCFLFTSQTVSSAGIMAASLPPNAVQQMAPLDTPAAAKRFMSHWSPALCIFAEGEIWPNLLRASQANGAKTALVNARMTAKSLKSWKRVRHTARAVFSNFDLIIAANQQTAMGLSKLLEQDVPNAGNLKTALAAKTRISCDETSNSQAPVFSTAHQVLLGASTHAGEEAILLEALATLPDKVRLIIAPRHPARADEIETLIAATGRPYARRSSDHVITDQTQILLADTFGEMDKWYHTADIVYLGGGHRPGIGGHSPLEPLSYNLPIITGPYTDNFTDTYRDLHQHNWAHIAITGAEIAARIPKITPPDPDALDAYFKSQSAALDDTLNALTVLLDQQCAL